MNYDALVEVLIQTLDPTSEHVALARREAAAIPKDFASESEWYLHVVSRPIERFLKTQEPFKPGAGFLVQQANGWTGFHANEASIALCRRVTAGQSADDAARWLNKVLTTETAEGLAILTLSGLTVPKVIQLGEGLTLYPIEALPNSGTKDWLLQQNPSASRNFSNAGIDDVPTAALGLRHMVKPYMHPAANQPIPPQADPHHCHSLLDEVRLLLSLIGPSSPLACGFWFQFSDADLADASRHACVFRTHQEIVPVSRITPVTISDAEAIPLALAYLAIGEPLRSTLRLSLRRFHQAMLRPANGDRAIELSIALESLLVDGSGENTYKLGLRAALLHGGSGSEKISVRALVSGLYALRSALIHDGVLPREFKLARIGRRAASDVVSDATLVTATILRKVLERGNIPDWYEFEMNPAESG